MNEEINNLVFPQSKTPSFLNIGLDTINKTVEANEYDRLNRGHATEQFIDGDKRQEVQITRTPEEDYPYELNLKIKSSEEIIQDLKQSGATFKFDEAIQEGYSPDEVVSHLANKQQQKDSSINQKLDQVHAHRFDKEGANPTDFDRGVIKSVAGLRLAINDAANWAGLQSDEDHAKIETQLQSIGKAMDNSIEDKDIFSMGTLGEIVPTLVTLPVSYQSKIAGFMVEGAIGYGSVRGTEDQGTAAITGLIAGGATAGIMKLLEPLDGRAIKKTFEQLSDRHLTTKQAKQEFDTYFKEWDETINVGKTFGSNQEYTTKTAALVDFLENAGASYKINAVDDSLVAEKSIRNIAQQRLDAVKELASVEDHKLVEFTDKLSDSVHVVQNQYNSVVSSIGTHPVKSIDLADGFSDDLLEGFNEAVASDLRLVRDSLTEDSIGGLIEAKQHINSIMRNTRDSQRVKKFKLDNLKKDIDIRIKEALPPNKYGEFKAAEGDYAVMSNVRNSAIGKVAKGLETKELTPTVALDKLSKINEGSNLFTDLEKLVGTEQAVNLEKLTLKSALNDKSIKSWESLSKIASKKGFVTAEGKALTETIDKFSKLFKVDDISKAIDGIPTASFNEGSKTSMVSAVAASLIKPIFTMVVKKIPFIDAAKKMNLQSDITRILKKPQELNKIMVEVEELSEPIKQKMVQDFVKQIEFKPQETAEFNSPENRLNRMREQRNQGKNPDIKPIEQRRIDRRGLQLQTIKAIRGSLPQLEANQVIDEAFKHFDNTRFGDSLHNISKSLVEGRLEDNVRKVNNLMKHEVDILAKEITRNTGLKPDKHMLRRLHQYIADEMKLNPVLREALGELNV